MRIFLLAVFLCVVFFDSARLSLAAAPTDARGHLFTAYAGSYRGLARGQTETMDIVVRGARLYVATHGRWESCWIAKPIGRGMAFVTGWPASYADQNAFAVDTFWEVAPTSTGLRIYDQELGGPLHVYDLKRVANKPRQDMLWAGKSKQRCSPKA
jgi:hypothetical protein